MERDLFTMTTNNRLQNVILSRLLVWVVLSELEVHKEITFMEICLLSQRYTKHSIPAYLVLDYLLKERIITSNGARLPLYSLTKES